MLNGDEPLTQYWVLDGILEGLKVANCQEECKQLLKDYTLAFNALYAKYINTDGTIDWHQILTAING